jgi:hypothetical protein
MTMDLGQMMKLVKDLEDCFADRSQLLMLYLLEQLQGAVDPLSIRRTFLALYQLYWKSVTLSYHRRVQESANQLEGLRQHWMLSS